MVKGLVLKLMKGQEVLDTTEIIPGKGTLKVITKDGSKDYYMTFTEAIRNHHAKYAMRAIESKKKLRILTETKNYPHKKIFPEH